MLLEQQCENCQEPEKSKIKIFIEKKKNKILHKDELDILDHITSINYLQKKIDIYGHKFALKTNWISYPCVIYLYQVPLKKVIYGCNFCIEDELDTLSLYHIHVPLSTTSKNQYEVGGSSYSVCRSLI
jgi:hypothetical protein